ncbi:MAG TPA: glycosyltransferase [Thermoanaerobaculia bacterium]
MKVLHVIDKSFLGGGQNSVRYLLEGFRGSDVSTLLSCRDGGPLVAAARDLGTPVHTIPFDKRFRPGPARALAALIRRERVDLVHAHGLVAATWATMARSFFGISAPLIYHQHGFHHHNYGPLSVGLRKAAERAVARRADRVVAASTVDRGRLVAGKYAEPQRIVMIHDTIPEPAPSPQDVEAARQAAALPPGAPVIGIVARLHPQKGVDVFLEAAAAVRAEFPSAAFVVIGEGELGSELRKTERRLGLEGAIRWLGGRPNLPFLPLFTVAAIPSRWEGIPLVLLEYMAIGLPIVATRIDGLADAVGPDEAELVPKDDAPALGEAILRLLRDPDLARRRGAAARRRFAATFSLASTVRRLRELYDEVLRG